jgi:glyoxylase-like metal-dependent hydrolase (beta-lactamase superfamily II)
VTQVVGLAPGLRRWTAWHAEWKEEVGAIAVETDDGLVLIDPIDPPRGLAHADHILLTTYWHNRDAGDFAAAKIWAARPSVRPLRNRGVEVTETVEDRPLPGGICVFATARTGEIAYWLPEQKAIVVGDVLLGAGAKPQATAEPLRLCPERWLGKASHADLRRTLRPLLDLPVQRVLVSHGAPVVRAGKRALASVLA